MAGKRRADRKQDGKSQQKIDAENREIKKEKIITDLNSIVWMGGFADLEYIQRKHGVPAYKGVHIRANTCPDEEGVITGADGAYLVTRYARQPITRVFHPTDVEYLGVAYVKREDRGGGA